MTKGYTITDLIHGEATLIAKSDFDGFTVYGFEEENLMSKNAIADLDVWKEEMEKIIEHLNEELDRLEIDLNKARNEYDFVAQQRDSMNSSLSNLSVYLWRMENN